MTSLYPLALATCTAIILYAPQVRVRTISQANVDSILKRFGMRTDAELDASYQDAKQQIFDQFMKDTKWHTMSMISGRQ